MRLSWIVVTAIVIAAAVAIFIAERGYDRLKWSGYDGAQACCGAGFG